jgi:hypothetical protein
METKDQYTQAHLVVSAIRVLEHQHSAPPSVEGVCKALSYTLEQGHLICRKLEELDIIEIVEGAFGTRISIKDHLAIEEIPRGIQESNLDKELKAFRNRERTKEMEVQSFKAKQDEKKKALFAEIEKKLKDNLEKKKTPTPSNDT